MFLSTHEKQLDAKRRLLVPSDFRATALAAVPGIEPFEGVYCFPAISAGCIECGGAAFFAMQRDVINSYPPMTATRAAMQTRFYASMHKLGFDTAGRITLPEKLCQTFGLTGDVVIAGMGESFQIWEPVAYAKYLAEQDAMVAAAFAKREAMI
ncbi:division/cell wall cluster transcriptional repressor MraZ [Asticcacaulis sp. 201]|uniref:division/cell wall cluster transcriptional repressor MraZ n=1 Tax=Asticcacaulis sp. 201 TaxID=3028787 RepID=UPI0029163DC9|nr:division/cell wall cluster transcriptional repressor MraZ [Asticcacaulis sp. 201]MDV6332047.1 division/cell wall cluster transcriptional repressor MraZ [Asticcacaulis sp. 201]